MALPSFRPSFPPSLASYRHFFLGILTWHPSFLPLGTRPSFISFHPAFPHSLASFLLSLATSLEIPSLMSFPSSLMPFLNVFCSFFLPFFFPAFLYSLASFLPSFPSCLPIFLPCCFRPTGILHSETTKPHTPQPHLLSFALSSVPPSHDRIFTRLRRRSASPVRRH